MKTIDYLSDETYYNMHEYNQITIDFLDEVEDILQEGVPTTDSLGSISYRISTLLDVINPKLEKDIEVLRELNLIIEEVIG